MLRVDCSGPEAALDSLARILGVQESELRDFSMRDLDWCHPELGERHIVLNALGFRNDESVPQPDSVRWFHATRVPKDTTFADGILPFDAAYERIWQALESPGKQMVGKDEWEGFKGTLSESRTNAAKRLRLKRRDRMWQGPFAHLLRQRAIDGYERPFHRSYTVAPEVVEELSSEFEARFKMSILSAYQEATAPCVVSFTREHPPQRVVGDALAYLHFSLRGEELPFWCDTIFSGYGETVTKAEIDDIDWL